MKAFFFFFTFSVKCNLASDFKGVILCNSLFIIVKANSSYHMDQGRSGLCGEATHESKEQQQVDSNPKSIF